MFMVEVNNLIDYINKKNISQINKDNIEEFLKTDKGKIVFSFLSQIKESTLLNDLKQSECEHSIEDIVLYKENELNSNDRNIIEMNILRCDTCFHRLQILNDFEKKEKLDIDNEKDNIEINLSNTELENNKIDYDFNKKQSDNLLKKIFKPYFVYGFTSGLSVAIAISIFFIPQKINTDIDSNNNFINQMSSENLTDNTFRLLNEGILLLKTGNIDESIDKLESLLKENSNIIDAYYYLGICYEKKGQKELSIRMFKKYLDLVKKEQVIINDKIKDIENKINE
jgi:tetratricopeptide (TPR) repeat protein